MYQLVNEWLLPGILLGLAGIILGAAGIILGAARIPEELETEDPTTLL